MGTPDSQPAARYAPISTTSVRLGPRALRELRLRLLTMPLGRDLELVEQVFDNGDRVLLLGQPGGRGEAMFVLGATKARQGT